MVPVTTNSVFYELYWMDSYGLKRYIPTGNDVRTIAEKEKEKRQKEYQKEVMCWVSVIETKV